MAKKKQDTKGLAGIVKNVPRELDIKGQKHMLAWITPNEGETLQALGGAGKLGPMGIPAFWAEGPPGASGPGDQPGADKGWGGDDSGKASDNKDVSGTTGTVSGLDPGYLSDEDYSQDIEQDIAARDYLAGKEDRNWVEEKMLDKLTKANLNQLAGYGLTPAQLAKHTATLNKYGVSEYEQKFAPFYSVPEDQLLKSTGAIKAPYGMEYDPVTGQYTGYRERVNPFGMAGLISKIFGAQPSAYTGFGKGSQPDKDLGGDGPDRDRPSGLSSLQEKPEKVVPVSVSPADYYSKGVGSATMDLYDPTKIDAYLAQLYGQTPSPIGASYNAMTGSYTMPGSDKKRKTRLRGLDIFKPVSM